MAKSLIILLILIFAGHSLADDLVVISPHWEGIRYEMGAAFKEHYKKTSGRDLNIQWRNIGGTSEIIRFVESEFIARKDSIGVDLIYGGGIDPFEKFKSLGVLERAEIPPAISSRIPADLSGLPLIDQDNTWFSTHLSAFGILCNAPALERLGISPPRDWKDLADKRYFGWIGSADPRKSGSMHSIYEIFLQSQGWAQGWQFIQSLARNIRSFSGNASQSIQDVTTGEVACTPSIDSYAWSQSKVVGEGRLLFVLPEKDTLINGDAVAVLKGAPNRHAAVEFVRFLLSEKAQRLLLLPLGEPEGPKRYELNRLALYPDLYETLAERTSVRLNPFSFSLSFRYQSELSLRRWRAVNELIGTFIIDGHSELKRGRNYSIPPSEEINSVIDNLEEPLLREKIISRWKDDRGKITQSSPFSSPWPSVIILFLIFLISLSR